MYNVGDFVVERNMGVGIVLIVINESIGVFFNERQPGLHRLDGHCADGHGWWCSPGQLEHFSDSHAFFCNLCGGTEHVTFNGECFVCDTCKDKAIKCIHCQNTMTYHGLSRARFVIANNEDAVCFTCMQELYDQCSNCRKYFKRDGNSLCPDCVAARRECTSCGNTFFDSETDIEVCYGCRSYCSRCDCFVGDENCEVISGDVYCPTCYETVMSRCGSNLMEPPEEYMAPCGILDYGYNPLSLYVYPDSSHSRDVLMGIELEVDGGATNRIADTVNEMLEYTYIEHDGSLDDGMEIVTHPATPEFHYVEKRDDWITAMKYMRDMGLRSHDAGTCGLHIHVSSVPLAAYKCDVVEKLMFLWDKHWDKLLKFSRRTNRQCDRWASRYSMQEVDLSSEDKMVRSSKKLRIKACADRYQAINLQNTFTVEFRMFRGTLNYTTFFATIQLLQHLINQSVCHTFTELDAMSWEELVKSEYEDLNKYLAIRGLKDGASQQNDEACDDGDYCVELEAANTSGLTDVISDLRESNLAHLIQTYFNVDTTDTIIDRISNTVLNSQQN